MNSGPPGVGKSSFICSLAAAFSQERWREHAYVGSHGDEGEPISVFMESYVMLQHPRDAILAYCSNVFLIDPFN